jgi:hypothetical protein
MKPKDILFLGPIPVSILGLATIQTNEGLGLGIYVFSMLWYFILWIGCLGAAIRMDPGGNERMLWILVVFFVNVLGVYIFYFKVLRKEEEIASIPSADSPAMSNSLEAIKKQYGSPKKHPRFKEYLAEDPARKYMENRDLQLGFLTWLQSKQNIEQVATGNGR